VAKYKKKRVRELQHDKFRDTTMGFLDQVGNRLEGKGRTILYGFVGLIVIALLVIFLVRWSGRKNDEALQALARGIDIASGQIQTPSALNPTPNVSGYVFSSEKERSQRAIDEFEKVAAKYGDPYRTQARFFIASNRLLVDRQKGMSELKELESSSSPEVSALSKFALAQANESDGKFDEAAKGYLELVKLNNPAITAESANLRLAKVYTKQGKKQEASDLLFNIVDASRKAKGKNDQPIPASAAAREAANELQKVDPDRYAKLPPESPILG
jgi:tetratricopeptide (TPR) repeat protein